MLYGYFDAFDGYTIRYPEDLHCFTIQVLLALELLYYYRRTLVPSTAMLWEHTWPLNGYTIGELLVLQFLYYSVTLGYYYAPVLLQNFTCYAVGVLWCSGLL